MSDKTPAKPPPSPPAALPIQEIEEAVSRVRFGTVQLIIQEGRIIQIDTTDKKRLI